MGLEMNEDDPEAAFKFVSVVLFMFAATCATGAIGIAALVWWAL